MYIGFINSVEKKYDQWNQIFYHINYTAGIERLSSWVKV